MSAVYIWYHYRSFSSQSGKRGDYQNCSVLYCVLKLCTVISTLRWAVLTVLWIGFWLTRPISLCVNSCVYVFFALYCLTAYVLYYCNMVGWSWWDWSLILEHLPSVLWHCWLGHSIRKNPSPIWPKPYSIIESGIPFIASWLLGPSNVTGRAPDDQCLGSLDDTIFVAKLCTVRNLPDWGPNYSMASFFASVYSSVLENRWHINGEL